MDKKILIKRTKSLIKENEPLRALEELSKYLENTNKDFSKTLIITFQRFKENEKNKTLNLIDSQEYQLSRNRIVDSILHIIDDIENDDNLIFDNKSKNVYGKLGVLYIINQPLLLFYHAVEKQILHVLEDTNSNEQAAEILLNSFTSQVTILSEIKHRIKYLNTLTIEDNEIKLKINQWNSYLQNELILNGKSKLLEIKAEIEELQVMIEEKYKELETIYKTNEDTIKNFKVIKQEIENALNHGFSPTLKNVLLQIQKNVDTLKLLKSYLDKFKVDENIDDLKFKLKITEFKDFVIKNVSLENTKQIFEKVKLFEKEYESELKNLKFEMFSQHVVNKYIDYKIDIGVIAELRGSERVPDIQVMNFTDNFIVDEQNLKEEIIIEGRNISNSPISYIELDTESAVPTPVKKMNAIAVDLETTKTLGVICNDEDQATLKTFRVYFKKPLKQGEVFKMKFSYILYSTMFYNTKDYIIVYTGFVEQLKNFKCNISFISQVPEYLQVVNLNTQTDTLVFMENNLFSIEFDEEVDYLNDLRLIAFFDRK